MAWTAPVTWLAGSTLTAAQLNEQVRDNSLAGGPIYTTEALRDAAIPTPYEGQRAYITATTIATAAGQITAIPTGLQTIYNGSVWVCVTQVGATTNTSCSTTTTASFADPSTAGGTNPTVTLVTGTTAVVDTTSTTYNSAGGAYSFVSFAVSGATTLAGSEAASYYYSGLGAVQADIVLSKRIVITGLTAGTNTFTMKYKASSGTSNYAYRSITVQGIA